MPAATESDSPRVNDGIHALPVLKDNIVWIWVAAGQAVVVDPAVAPPVIDWLQARELTLRAVLQTHHHPDHIGGTPELLQRWPNAEVVAAAADRDRIPFQTLSVRDGDRIPLLNGELAVLDVPAHTRAHVAYVLMGPADQPAALFCGDTLFSGGCGRLFEGTPADMHKALQRFSRLPSETGVHCAHEYTEANLRWASAINPADQKIADRLRQVQALRARGGCSLPSTIEIERETNLMMRAANSEELAVLRSHKDQWRG